MKRVEWPNIILHSAPEPWKSQKCNDFCQWKLGSATVLRQRTLALNWFPTLPENNSTNNSTTWHQLWHNKNHKIQSGCIDYYSPEIFSKTDFQKLIYVAEKIISQPFGQFSRIFVVQERLTIQVATETTDTTAMKPTWWWHVIFSATI